MIQRIGTIATSNGAVQKAVWLSMLLGHVPACISATCSFVASPGPDELVRLVLLVVSQVFFLLKLADVSWLRLRADRAAWMRGLLIVALLHGGIVARNVESAELHRATPVALSTLWAVILPSAAIFAAFSLRLISMLRRGVSQPRPITSLRTTCQRLAGWSPVAAQLVFVRASAPLRAPPLR